MEREFVSFIKRKNGGKKNGSAKAVAVYKNDELIRNFDTVHEATIWARDNGITNKRYLIQSLTNNLPIIYKTKSSKYPNGNGFLFRYEHSKMELRKANE